MKPYLLGIDIGTSACKIAVFDGDGKVAASASGEYPVYYPKPGWAEQNPGEWWAAIHSSHPILRLKYSGTKKKYQRFIGRLIRFYSPTVILYIN